MRENRLSGSMRGEARRSLALASQPARFAYSTHGQQKRSQKSKRWEKFRAVREFHVSAAGTLRSCLVAKPS